MPATGRGAAVNARLVREWREKASRLDRIAEQQREAGTVKGPWGAEEAEAVADDYRAAADELEFDAALGEGRR